VISMQMLQDQKDLPKWTLKDWKDLPRWVSGLEGSAEVDMSGKCKLGGVINRFAHLGLVDSGVQIPKVGDIVIEHHPHTGKGRRFFSPEEFKASLREDLGPMEPPDNEPWHPFHVRGLQVHGTS
jgi:hypothetical protein